MNDKLFEKDCAPAPDGGQAWECGSTGRISRFAMARDTLEGVSSNLTGATLKPGYEGAFELDIKSNEGET
jgi:hypothetical protein